MSNLTIRDRAQMKMLNNTIRGWFLNSHDVPFHKDFKDLDAMNEFIEKARAVGTIFVSCNSL